MGCGNTLSTELAGCENKLHGFMRVKSSKLRKIRLIRPPPLANIGKI